MRVNLVAYTQPSQYLIDFINEDRPDPDENISLQDIICYVARVSNPANQNNTVTTDKLLSYLMRHKHWSPFEMVDVVLELETTRDIARQVLRHRSFSFQEFSQRYADINDLSSQAVIRETRFQDFKNRQNSIEISKEDFADESNIITAWEAGQSAVYSEAMMVYDEAIANGVAKEVARAVLPEGMTPSRLYMKGSIRSWIHYIQLRTDPSTQKEHRILAEECAKAIEPIFGKIVDAVYKKPTPTPKKNIFIRIWEAINAG